MRDGAIMANSGHFDAELDLARCGSWPRATSARSARTSRSSTSAAKKLNLIAEGRLVNLGAAEGHPAAVMDMSFANQALSAEYVALHHAELERGSTSCRPTSTPRSPGSSSRPSASSSRMTAEQEPYVALLAARHLAGLEVVLQPVAAKTALLAPEAVLRGREPSAPRRPGRGMSAEGGDLLVGPTRPRSAGSVVPIA